MRYRQKMSRKRSRRQFSKTASWTNKRNLPRVNTRGGIRL